MDNHNLTGFSCRFRSVVDFNHVNIKPAGHRCLALIFQAPGNGVQSGVSLDRFRKNFLAQQAEQAELNRRVATQINHELDGFAIRGDIRLGQSA